MGLRPSILGTLTKHEWTLASQVQSSQALEGLRWRTPHGAQYYPTLNAVGKYYHNPTTLDFIRTKLIMIGG